jgi:serine/threonine protein kinase
MKSTNQQVESIFDAARLLTDPASREVFLEQACAGDRELRALLDELLSAKTEADQFFSKTPARSFFSLSASGDGTDGITRTATANGHARNAKPSQFEAPGTRIDRYKLLQRIGEGGCGVVYMAEQEKPVRRRVALKVIRLGMDTESVIARFEVERQALALMDHPNIARVLDAGATENGRPYFVMELVRGVRITDYCDQHHLDTSQRLDLFVQICHAIQHAHQKGIIHRDIKPSNILITLHDGVPVPKVIDFGIAKATEGHLTDRTLFTAYEQFIGTPAYMSPEQAEMSGLDIDTRSDIYSLGVLLYELLTGRTPFDGKKLVQSGLEEMRRTLREREPQRPSTMLTTLGGTDLTAAAQHRHAEVPKLISMLKGDVDWIVMKSLEKDRRRRYETANGLAMDIQRYLHNEPVIARPPSRLYRFRKLVRRNKVVFASTAAVAAALVAGLGTSTWMFFREREARQRAVAAERQEKELRQKAETKEKLTQALILIREERFEDAEKLLGEIPVLQPTVEGATVFRSLGEWHALQERWKEASYYFAALLQIDRLDERDVSTLDMLECGPTLIELGDFDRYERFRNSVVARFDGNGDLFADRIIKISLLLPADARMISVLEPMAEVTTKTLAPEVQDDRDVFQAAWRSMSLALFEYRRGDYAKAVKWCQRCLAYSEYNAPRSATARVVLAMSLHQLGQTADARTELALGRDIIENKFLTGLDRGTGVQGFWFDWVFARILSREASRVIEPWR